MRDDHDATMLVRAELCERLDAVRNAAWAHHDVASSVAAIRRLALAYGLTPVVRLADALARSDGPCATALYIDRLYDAIGCDSRDEQASQAMLASVSVRLSR